MDITMNINKELDNLLNDPMFEVSIVNYRYNPAFQMIEEVEVLQVDVKR